jgi:hypothetical protein
MTREGPSRGLMPAGDYPPQADYLLAQAYLGAHHAWNALGPSGLDF